MTECEKDGGRGGIGRGVGVGGGEMLTNRFCRWNGVTRGRVTQGPARGGCGKRVINV